MASDARFGETSFIPVILAGGSGTRFWPRSRRFRPKQVLTLEGSRSMIQQTVDRLALVTAPSNIWIVANEGIASILQEQLPQITKEHLLCEPAARNTAPACGLAAFLTEKTDPDAVLGIFPSDHVVRDAQRFASALKAGIAVASSGENIVVLGVPPTRAETGYGYIEQGDVVAPVAGLPIPVRRVHRFTEKPDARKAREFVESGRYAWNSGIFLWTARTLCNALREHAPEVAAKLTEIADAHGTPKFQETLHRVYPQCENISIDYAVLEPRSAREENASGIYCLPAEFGWNDLGSWTALYEHARSVAAPGCDVDGNVVDGLSAISMDADDNYVYAPGKCVALVGVHGLVIVETEDAILITTRDRSQDVGGVVKALNERGSSDLT